MGRLFKLISNFFFLIYIYFRFFSPLFALLAAFLIWKGSSIVQILCCLLLLLIAYYQIRWISPWYVVRGRELVQKFKLNEFDGILLSSILSPWWSNFRNVLLFVPDEQVFFPQFKNALVVNLETRQTHCQPMSELNLDGAKRLEFLHTGYREQLHELSLHYASASKKGVRSESSFIGFSLPILSYRIPFPCGGSYGWDWGKTYFGWKRLVVREFNSGSVLVELNKIVFNDDGRYYSEDASAWVMEGKFLILYSDRRVLVLGAFNTQSSDNKRNEI